MNLLSCPQLVTLRGWQWHHQDRCAVDLVNRKALGRSMTLGMTIGTVLGAPTIAWPCRWPAIGLIHRPDARYLGRRKT